jgi:methylenetetrahydrofolate reductase (NADPH)
MTLQHDASTRPAPLKDAKPRISFEFFPPKSAELEAQLWRAVDRLAPLKPTFVSVTYGAGGSTRERTLGVLKRILAETTLKPAAHLTCVAATREEVDAVVREYWEAGVRHIVSLRGDPPGQLGGAYEPEPNSYCHATELTAATPGSRRSRSASPPILRSTRRALRSCRTSTC